MPAKIKKKGKCYSVSTPNRTHAKCTTKAKAKRQRNLLNALDYGWQPTRSRKRGM